MTSNALSKPQNDAAKGLLTPGPGGESLSPAVEPEEFGYGHFLAIFGRRRFWFLGILMAVFAGTAFWTLRATPIYQSSMMILIEPNYQAKESGNEEDFADANVEVDAATQMAILQSSEVLQQALDSLLPEYPTLSIRKLQKNLSIEPYYGSGDEDNRRTDIIEISYQSEDREQTQRILQTLLSVYQLYNLEQQKLRLSRGLAFINEQLPEARKSIAAAEASLQSFRSQQGLIDPNERAETTAVAVKEIKNEREKLKAQYSETNASFLVLQRQMALPPDQAILAARLSESNRYQSLLDQIQATELDLSRQQQQLTEDHPTIENLQRQHQDQLALLQQEIKRVLGPDAPQVLQQGSLLNQGQLTANDQALAAQLADLQKDLESLDARDQSLAQTEATLTAELQRYPQLIAEYNRLQPEVQTRRQTLDKLLTARQELGLEIARGGFEWKLVEAPQLGYKISPNTRQNLLLGLAMGLFLGALGALLRDALDDRVHTSEDLDNQIPLPLLGIIPELSRKDTEGALVVSPFPSQPEPMAATPEIFQWQPLRESLDLIYTNIQLLQAHTPYRSLMVTSALAGEGKSTLSIGLALSAARLDQRVLLIDADLRNPRLHQMFNLNNHQGLSTLLTGNISLDELNAMPQWVYMRWENPEEEPEPAASPMMRSMPPSDLNLDVLTSGPIPSDPVKLFKLDQMKDIIATFQDSYDLILIDSPPVLGLVDTIPVGLGCDGVVMIARIDRVTRTELSKAITVLNKLNVVGLVANGVNPASNSYSQLSQHYNYQPT